MIRTRFVSKRAALIASLAALPFAVWLERSQAPADAGPRSGADELVRAPVSAPRATRTTVSVRWPEPLPSDVPFVPTQRGFVAGESRSGLAAELDADGSVRLRVGDRVDVRLRLRRAGRSGATANPALATRVEAGRAIVDRGAIDEWYVHTSGGVEQGFDLASRPAGEGSVVLTLGVEGARPVSTGSDAVLVQPDGTPALSYRDLVVVDANGRVLPSSIRVGADALALVFDDRDAAYPVRVDPFVSTAFATLNAASVDLATMLGCGQATAIVNGLAAVGCPNMPGPNGEAGAGAVLLFQQSTSGGNTAFTYLTKLQASTPSAGAHFGKSLAFDGQRLVVGAPDQMQSVNTNVGHVYVFSASGTGNLFNETASLGPADPSTSLLFGASVALDGHMVLVGAPGGSPGALAINPGSAYLFDLAAASPYFVAEFGAPNGASDDGFGASVAMQAGRILVGAPGRDAGSTLNVGTAYAFTLGATPTPTFAMEVANPTPSDGAGYGASVAIDDPTAVVGCPRCANLRGAGVGSAMVFTAGVNGWALATTLVPPDGIAGDFFGMSVAVDGDVIVVGAPGVGMPAATSKIGAAYLFVDEGDAWLFGSKLRPTDAVAGDGVGFSVDVDRAKNQVILGVPMDAIGNVVQAGSARVFGIPGFSYVYVTVSGTGTGSVASLPDGILCPTDCVEVYADGASVKLTATPAAGSYLASIDGACTVSPCTFVVNGPSTTDVVFEPTKPNGEACTQAFECTSGRCVDGVCCNDVCGNGVEDCQACSVAAGGTLDGNCTPLDADTAAARICHPSTGLCDPQETCSANSTICPANVLAPSGSVCRPSRQSVCDPAETCSGSTGECPADVVAPVATGCDNGITCDGIARCDGAGACIAGAAPVCVDDGNPCTVDLCADPVGCISVAQPGCTVVDGGAVFVDAGISLDASLDGSSEAGVGDGAVVPRPPTFQGEGGCSCGVTGEPHAGSRGVLFAAGLLALVLVGRRRRR